MKNPLKSVSNFFVKKKKLSAGLLFLAIFGVSAGSAYALVPQTVIKEHEVSKGDDIAPEHEMTTRERFISNLANNASNGMSITANKLLFEIDGKNETRTENGQEVVTSHVNTLDASGTTIDFALTSLSLHGVKLALTAPVVYSDAGARPHARGVHASLIDDSLYLNLFDAKEEVVDGAKKMLYNDSWDFKYKVDLAPYDGKFGPGESETDSKTGGIFHYEYGDLDWLLEDIFYILSDGGIDLSLEGWLDSLLSSKEEEPSAPAQNAVNDTPAQEPAENGISVDAIMNSMDEMVEVAEERYFIWHLPLGSKTLNLGLRADEDYNLAGVDLPAKYDFHKIEGEEAQYETFVSEESAWEIQEGMRLQVSADVTDFEIARGEWSKSLIPGDADSYRDLMDSKGMLKYVAKYIANPQFGLDVDLDIGYATSSKAGDRTHVKKEAIADSMRVHLSADADLAQRKFNGAKAQLSLQKVDELKQVTAHHDINVAYLYDHENKQGDGFLDINENYFKARTTSVYLDEFYASFLSDLFTSTDAKEQAEDDNTLNQITEVLKVLGISLDDILNSDFITDLHNGVYVSALDFIESIENDDNLIQIVLTLAPIGLEGKITLKVSGRGEQHDLLSLDIEGIKFASFCLDGHIATRAFEAIDDAILADESYDKLCHLQGIGEQVTNIVNNKSFTANLGVSLLNEDVEELGVNGDLAFAFADELKAGKVDVRLTQNLTDKIVPNHRIALDLYDSFNGVAFTYGSSLEDDLDTLPEESIKAKLGFSSFVEEGESILDKGLGLFKNMDDRFSRLTASLAKTAGTSLLSRLTRGELSAILEENGILKSAKIHDDNGDTTIVINGSKLGMENDIVVSLEYEDNTIDPLTEKVSEGGIKGLKVNLKLGEKDLVVTLGDIDSIELEDATTPVPQGKKPLGALKEGIESSFRNFDDVESFKDIGFVSEILDYAVGTLTLGTVASEDEEGNNIVNGISYYGIEGNLEVGIGAHDLKVGLFDAYASVEGAETKIYAKLGGIPVIRGVNGPDNAHYFRPHEAEGVREAEIYYYANGVDPKGQALLTRESSYGRIRNVRDGVRLEGEDFVSDLFGWLGRYSLGILDSILDKEDTASPKPQGLHKLSRQGILGDEPLRIESVLNGLSKTSSNNIDTYTISVDLGALLGIPVLGDANISLKGTSFVHDGKTFKTLQGINIHAEGKANAVNSEASLALAHVDVDLFLNNIHDGVMDNVWEYQQNRAYAENFVGEVADDGILNEESKGLLYELPDQQFNSLLPDKETEMFGYNYVGYEGTFKASNLYIL